LLNSVLTFLNIKKEIPDAFGYDVFGPVSYPIPEEFKQLLEANEVFSEGLDLCFVRIDNYSSKLQKDVRILYSGDFEYRPSLTFHRRDVSVRYSIAEEEKEIVIEEIPPNESISIEIFNPTQDFQVDQILSGDHEITSLMQKLAEARRYPDLARMKLASVCLMSFTTLVLIATGYLAWGKIAESNRIEAAYSGFLSCTPSFVDNPPDYEKMLKRRFEQLDLIWQNNILSSNHVRTFDELKLKDEILWCEPNNS